LKSNKDYVIVKVSAETNDTIQTNIVDKDGKKIELILDTNYGDGVRTRYMYNRIYGEVVSAPKALSKAMGAYHPYVGWPPKFTYRGHDFIQAQERRQYLERDLPVPQYVVDSLKAAYRCSTYEMQSFNDPEVKVREGDKVYFHYLSIHNDNYLGRSEDGMKLFKVRHDHIFCKVYNMMMCGITNPEDVIVMLNNYCLVSPYYGEDFKEVEVGKGKVQAKTKMVGKVELVTELKDKPEHLKGILRHIGKGFGETIEALPGDKVVYIPNSEFENEIEGEKYYVMKQDQIVANLGNNCDRPYGDYVVIQPDEYLYKGLILIPDVARPKPSKGKVLGKGCRCEEIEVGDTAYFYNNDALLMKEFNRVLVREQNIWGRER
jgi:co-chaperonin GroES (HSP10)